MPSACTLPSAMSTTVSAWSSIERARGDDDGRLAGAEVVELARDAGLGVGVDGARRLDEHEDLGVGEQRPREHESLSLAAREGAAALVDDLVETGRQSDEHVLRGGHLDRIRDLAVARACPRVELAAERAREDQRIGLADEDPPADDRERQPVELRLAEQHTRARDDPAEPVGEQARLVGCGGDEAREPAGRDRQPGGRVAERHAGRRLRQRVDRILDGALDSQHPQHPAGADERARDFFHRLGGGAQRDHEEAGVAVERHELARRDVTRGREMGADPGDKHDKEPR